MKFASLGLLTLLLWGCAKSGPPGEAPAEPAGRAAPPTESKTETPADPEETPAPAGDPQEKPASGAATASETALPPLSRGAEVSDFSLPDVQGETHQLSALLASEGVSGAWISVWDVACPYCETDLPKMASAYADLKGKGLQWIGVAINTSVPQATDFAEKHQLEFLNLLDSDKKVAPALQTSATPYNLLIDKNRKVMAVYQGTGDKVLSAVQKDAEEFITTGKVTSKPVGAGKG